MTAHELNRISLLFAKKAEGLPREERKGVLLLSLLLDHILPGLCSEAVLTALAEAFVEGQR